MADNDVLILSFPIMAKLLLGCNMPVAYLQIIMLMVLGIPSFMLFYNGSRMVFRFDRIKYLGLTMFNIWVVGIVFLVFFSLNAYKLYKMEEKKQMEVTLEKPAADTLYLKLRAEDTGMKYLYNEKYTFVNDLRTIISDEGELYIVPNIRFEESKDSLFTVSQVLLAREITGRSSTALGRNTIPVSNNGIYINDWALRKTSQRRLLAWTNRQPDHPGAERKIRQDGEWFRGT